MLIFVVSRHAGLTRRWLNPRAGAETKTTFLECVGPGSAPPREMGCLALPALNGDDHSFLCFSLSGFFALLDSSYVCSDMEPNWWLLGEAQSLTRHSRSNGRASAVKGELSTQRSASTRLAQKSCHECIPLLGSAPCWEYFTVPFRERPCNVICITPSVCQDQLSALEGQCTE